MNLRVETYKKKLLELKKEYPNIPCLNIQEYISEDQCVDYLAAMKELKVRMFSISSQQTSLADILFCFQELGCKVERVIKLELDDTIKAVLLRIGEVRTMERSL